MPWDIPSQLYAWISFGFYTRCSFACNISGPDVETGLAERAEDPSLEVGTKFVTGENESVKLDDTFHLYLTSDLHDYCTAWISASYENENGSKDVIVKLAKVTYTPHLVQLT